MILLHNQTPKAYKYAKELMLNFSLVSLSVTFSEFLLFVASSPHNKAEQLKDSKPESTQDS